MSPEDAHSLIADVDINGDGRIDYREFARIMQYSDEAMMANNGVQTLRALSGFGGNNLPQSPAQSPAASLREAVVTTATAVTSSAAAAAASTTTEEP